MALTTFLPGTTMRFPRQVVAGLRLRCQRMIRPRVQEEVVTSVSARTLGCQAKFKEANFDFVSADFDAPKVSDITCVTSIRVVVD
jgi:hypothetical protein